MSVRTQGRLDSPRRKRACVRLDLRRLHSQSDTTGKRITPATQSHQLTGFPIMYTCARDLPSVQKLMPLSRNGHVVGCEVYGCESVISALCSSMSRCSSTNLRQKRMCCSGVSFRRAGVRPASSVDRMIRKRPEAPRTMTHQVAGRPRRW